jgi:hypothetical protein
MLDSETCPGLHVPGADGEPPVIHYYAGSWRRFGFLHLMGISANRNIPAVEDSMTNPKHSYEKRASDHCCEKWRADETTRLPKNDTAELKGIKSRARKSHGNAISVQYETIAEQINNLAFWGLLT